MNLKLLIIIVSSLCMVFSSVAQPKIASWNYPVKPGDKEWALFKSGKEMENACQIPESVLKTISTKELANLCMSYPMRMDYLAANDQREGVKYIIQHFNGLKELSKRVDGTQALIRIYEEAPVYSMLERQAIESKNLLDLPYLELLLSDDCFVSQLSEIELIKLGKVVLRKYDKKADNTAIYGFFNLKSSLLLGAIVIDKTKGNTLNSKQKNIVKHFIDTYGINMEPSVITDVSKIILDL